MTKHGSLLIQGINMLSISARAAGRMMPLLADCRPICAPFMASGSPRRAAGALPSLLKSRSRVARCTRKPRCVCSASASDSVPLEKLLEVAERAAKAGAAVSLHLKH
jgi:hypothetical protein